MFDGWPRPSVRAPASVTRFPGTVSGTCGIGSRSPWPPPFAPPPPLPVGRPCSAASLLLGRSLTSHARASSASVPHLPDADQSALQPVAGHETSQVPTRSFRTRCGLRPRRSDGISHSDAAHVAFDGSERLGLRKILPFVAQSHTPSDHCVRFAPAVADDCATLASRRRATTLPGPIFHRQKRVSFAWTATVQHPATQPIRSALPQLHDIGFGQPMTRAGRPLWSVASRTRRLWLLLNPKAVRVA